MQKKKKKKREKRKGAFNWINIFKAKTKFKLNFFSLFREIVLMESSFKSDRHPRLRLLRLYNGQLRRWHDNMTFYGENFQET